MPYYRIILKLEKAPKQVFVTEFPDKDINSVYSLFEKRVNEKYGAGKVEYFNCVMVAEKTLDKLPERNKILLVPADSFGLDGPDSYINKKGGKERKVYQYKPTLGERAKK